ncbi:hypothetical protein Emag_005181 [Eimeria magna]
MVTCQGCGESTASRLCCPNCTEAGRTSFFCSQECFRASWPSHSKLHALIQRGAPRGIKKGGPEADGSSSPGGPPGWSHNDTAADSTEAAQGKNETVRTQPDELSSSSSSSSSLERGSTSQRREEETGKGDGASSSLPVVPSRVSRGLGLIQARGLTRSSSSSSGSPSKGVASEGMFSRILSGRKRPVEIPLHVRGESRKDGAGTGKHLSPAAAAAAATAGGPPLQGVPSRASLLLLLLLGALLCYITFGGLLFSITGGLLGGPSSSVQQQGRPEAAAAAGAAAADGSESAAAPALVSLEQAVLQLRDRVSSLEGLLKEHEAFFAAIETQLSPTVSSDETPAAAVSRAQRAAGALGHSVASHPAAVAAGVAPPGAAAARARPLLELLKRVRERGVEETASAATAAPETPPLVQRSYVAGVASERGPAAAGPPSAPLQEVPSEQQQQQQQQQKDEAAANRGIHFAAQEAPHALAEAGAVRLAPAADTAADAAAAAAAAATAAEEAGGGAAVARLEPIESDEDRGLGSSALLSGTGGHLKRSKRSSNPS